MLRTHNNADGSKLVIFSGIALYYGDTCILPTLIGKLPLDVVMNLECGKLKLVHRSKTLAAELLLQVLLQVYSNIICMYSVVLSLYYDIHTPDTQVAVDVSSLHFSPDGTHLAAGLSTGEVQVFERWSGNSLFNISSPEV